VRRFSGAAVVSEQIVLYSVTEGGTVAGEASASAKA